MPTPKHLRLRTKDPDNILWPHIGLLSNYLAQGRYHDTCRRKYIASALHFGEWLAAESIMPERMDENSIRRFITEHLVTCSCDHKTPHSVVVMRAALNHLLRVLKANGVVRNTEPSETDGEIARFDEKMLKVWGLSKDTRRHRGAIIRRLLDAQGYSNAAGIAWLKPAGLRNFVMGAEPRKPATIRSIAGAVRCYLRYRAIIGDNVRHLERAIPTPTFKPAAELPQGLTPSELQQLLASFVTTDRNQRRAYAIVRCLADLGLRSLEVVRLTLDDIDWENGIINVPATKTRRRDIMPLPTSTGEAIADYLINERPATEQREIFVRHVAPVGRPVGRRVVQKALHAAYRRLGWQHTRVHILRHTIASALANDGVPLKQIADVMRHRSVVTTAGYARVDTVRLSAVALPWPGEIA
jgi:integrase/recombinase XerD